MGVFDGMTETDQDALDELVQLAGVILSAMLVGVTLYNTMRFFDEFQKSN